MQQSEKGKYSRVTTFERKLQGKAYKQEETKKIPKKDADMNKLLHMNLSFSVPVGIFQRSEHTRGPN